MRLEELDNGEKFKFKNDTWTKMKRIKSHNAIKEDIVHDIFDCMSSEGRHRPFRGDTDVEPLQRRIKL